MGSEMCIRDSSSTTQADGFLLTEEESEGFAEGEEVRVWLYDEY